MATYGMDLRMRVIHCHEEEQVGYEYLAQRFFISRCTVQAWISQYRRQGHCEPRRPGPSPQDCTLIFGHLKVLLEKHNDATLEELARLLHEDQGIKASRSSVDRWLRAMKVTRKKSR